jgi:hypothetical protein
MRDLSFSDGQSVLSPRVQQACSDATDMRREAAVKQSRSLPRSLLGSEHTDDSAESSCAVVRRYTSRACGPGCFSATGFICMGLERLIYGGTGAGIRSGGH